MTLVSPPSCSITHTSVETRVQLPGKISRSLTHRQSDSGDVSVKVFSLVLLYVITWGFMGVVTTALIDFSQEYVSNYELDIGY